MEFVFTDKPAVLLPILECRLPKSSNSYNMVLMSAKFTQEMRVFILRRDGHADIGSLEENCWVLIVNNREDLGAEVIVSPPTNFQMTDEIKDAFIKSTAFDWTKPYVLSGIEQALVPTLLDISVFAKGNITHSYPCTIYYISREDAKKLQIPDVPGATIKPMGITDGSEFCSRNWKYSTAGTNVYSEKVLARNGSTGIYVDGKIVCGILLNSHGYIGMLHTEKEHRQKGYAKICFRNEIKNCAEKGFFPCSSVEFVNTGAAHFHKKVGMKPSHDVAFMLYFAAPSQS